MFNVLDEMNRQRAISLFVVVLLHLAAVAVALSGWTERPIGVVISCAVVATQLCLGVVAIVLVRARFSRRAVCFLAIWIWWIAFWPIENPEADAWIVAVLVSTTVPVAALRVLGVSVAPQPRVSGECLSARPVPVRTFVTALAVATAIVGLVLQYWNSLYQATIIGPWNLLPWFLPVFRLPAVTIAASYSLPLTVQMWFVFSHRSLRYRAIGVLLCNMLGILLVVVVGAGYPGAMTMRSLVDPAITVAMLLLISALLYLPAIVLLHQGWSWQSRELRSWLAQPRFSLRWLVGAMGLFALVMVGVRFGAVDTRVLAIRLGNPEIQVAAMSGLSAQDSDRTYSHVMSLLTHPNYLTSSAAASCAARIAGERFVTDALKPEYRTARVHIAEAMREIPTSVKADALSALLQDESRKVREAAARNSYQVPELFDELCKGAEDEGECYLRGAALSSLVTDRLPDALVRLGDDDPQVRQVVAVAFSYAAWKKVPDIDRGLARALGDSDERVREVAVSHYARLKSTPPEILPDLVRALERTGTRGVKDVMAAMRGLPKPEAAQLITLLRVKTTSEDWWTRTSAAASIAALRPKDPKACETLQTLLQHNDSERVQEAMVVMFYVNTVVDDLTLRLINKIARYDAPQVERDDKEIWAGMIARIRATYDRAENAGN